MTSKPSSYPKEARRPISFVPIPHVTSAEAAAATGHLKRFGSCARLSAYDREAAVNAMRFRTYPKISKAPSMTARSVGGMWVALEKVHGAQLVVGVDAAGAVRFGKRKDWLQDDDAFFGWQLLRDDLAACARRIARVVGAPQLFLYGELFGGGYPHPHVPPVPGMSPVQTGVWYAPDLRYSPFDLLVAPNDEDEGEFLAHADVEQLTADVSLITPPIVRRGRRSDLEGLSVRATTRIPQTLGLPPIEGNIAEGLVLKPDARLRPSERPVLKRKIPEFDDAKFDESAAFSPGRLSFAELSSWLPRLVNDARVQSARSKVGLAPAAVLDEVVLDVAIDFELAFPEAWAALGPTEQQEILDRTRRLAADLLRGA